MTITKVSRGLLNTGISDSSDATAITIDSGENVGIGTSAIPHGGIGSAKLAIEGGDQNFTTGPHIQLTTALDDYPITQILGFSHDNISINFDSYHDGTSWKSSDAGTNFQIYKLSDSLQFRYAAGVAAGSEPTWAGAININSSGQVVKPQTPHIYGSPYATSGAGIADGFTAHGTLSRNTITVTTVSSQKRFIAPVTGIYHISLNMIMDQTANLRRDGNIAINGTDIAQTLNEEDTSGYHYRSQSITVDLDANDYVTVFSHDWYNHTDTNYTIWRTFSMVLLG